MAESGCSPSMVRAREGGYIPALDGVRGMAILLVIVWHYVQGQLSPAGGAWQMWLKQALGFTWSGVDLFFVLSGFLIAGILLDNQGKAGYFRTFYIRRACRILPLYYVNVLIFMLLGSLSLYQHPGLYPLFQVTPVPEWSYALFVQNLFMGASNSFGPGWLSVTWSLAVEEQFYLLLPFIVYFVPVNRLLFVFAWFAAMAVYLRYELPGFHAYINTPWRADSLMVGALLALLVRDRRFARQVVSGWGRFALYAVFWVLLLGALASNLFPQRPFSLTFTYLWLAVLYASLILIVLVNDEGWMARVFRRPWLVWLGTISYGVYLVHQPLGGLIHGLSGRPVPRLLSWEDLMLTALAFFATLLLAWLSRRVMEERFIQFGRRFRYGGEGAS